MRQKHRTLLNSNMKRAPAVKSTEIEDSEEPPQPRREIYSLTGQSYTDSGEPPIRVMRH